MKKIYNIVSMAILLFCTAACSDSYLELSPESSVSDEVIFENADAAQYAVNGLGRIMSTQYLDTQGYNGEGTVYAYQGEYPGDVIQKGSYTGWQNLAKGNYFTSSTNSNIHVTWYYYYKLIRNANQILDNCKTGLANVAEQRKWDYIKAQALVYRAYSYTMLSQLYSRRWTDADGLQRGLVLRTTVNNDEMPCSTMAETQYRLGNEQAVRALLEQTVKPYNADYTCTKSGDSLWEELKAYRKFDLCNEGHSWFDLKRWGDPMVRKTWAEGGSWATYFAEKNTTTGGNYGPADKNAWTAVIPTMETNYNSLVSNVEKIKSDGTWDRN